MKPPKRDLDDVLVAIKGSGGIKTVIAARLQVSRQTVDSYLHRWKTAEDAYDTEMEVNLDVAESVIVGNIRNAARMQQSSGGIVDSGDAWKYVKLKGQQRGYVERQEVQHSGEIKSITYIKENRPDDS